MVHSDPVGLPGLATLAVMLLLGGIAFIAARRRRDGEEAETQARRSSWGTLGVAVQAIGLGIVGFGRVLVTLDPLGAKALTEAVAIAALLLAALGLFVWSSRTMGRNWSIRARTLADHALIQDGPFRYLRHPIYVAIGLYAVALAVALGHAHQLLLALPVYAAGTAIRVRSEEALLRQQFGTQYDAYAARVKRFVPGVF